MLNKPEAQPDKKEAVVIKKYANRRLYNTETSTYVTLEDLAQMVRRDKDFVVYDAKSGDDLTHAVLTQIIVEQESRQGGQTLLPIPFLRQLIRFYDDSIGRLVPSYLQFSLENLVKEQEKFRPVMKHMDAVNRMKSFAEVELGFDEKAAIEEAKRCLRCDLRLQIRQPVLPPEKWLRFEAEAVATVPECEGVFQLFDEKKKTIYIKGTMNLRKELMEQLPDNKEAKCFLYEEAKMFTMRESELLQQFMKKHGKMPDQNVGLEEDLY